MYRIRQMFYVDTNRVLRNALDTWNLVEEEALEACVPYFVQGMAGQDLSTYIYTFRKAIQRNLLPPEYNAAMCRFFIRVIQYRRDAAHFLKADIVSVLCRHMTMEYMKGQYYSYITAKKVLVWMSILNLRAVIEKLKFNILYKELNAAVVDTLTEVTSLCAKVVIPHIVDLLPTLSRLVKHVRDQPSKETLCYAIRRLSGSIQEYTAKSDRYKVQLMKAMSNIKTNISPWLHHVHPELRDSIKVSLEPFTAPQASEDHPTKPHTARLQTLPQTRLLEKYRMQTVKEKPEDTEKKRTEMSELVISLVTGRKIPKDFLQSLLAALKNATPKTRMTAVMFFSEALKHRRLMNQKDQESVIQHLLKITEEDDDILCSIAMEGLGNAVTGVPGLVESYKNGIIAHLETRLSKTSNPKVILAALGALSFLIRRLKLSVLSGQFTKICREHMDYPDRQVQITTINLLKDLTESCRHPLFSNFTDEVRSFIPTLLLKLHGDNQEMAAASTSSLQSCLSYIRGTKIQGSFRLQKSPNISDRGSIYSCLAHDHPALMKTLLLQTPGHLVNSEDKEAVVRHVEFLKDAINHDVLKDMDLHHLSQALAALYGENYPLNTKRATETVVSILGTKWLYPGWPTSTPPASGLNR